MTALVSQRPAAPWLAFTLLLALLLAVSQLGAAGVSAEEHDATVDLKDVQGRTVGQAQMTVLEDGLVRVQVELAGMMPVAGDHRFAVTEIADCEAPTFNSAGQEVVALPEIPFYANGSASYDKVISFDLAGIVSLYGGSLVIYADKGEEPGDRILCGTIEAGVVPAPEPTTPASTPLPTPEATREVIPQEIRVTADLMDISGRRVGEATLKQLPQGVVQVNVTLRGMDPVAGSHGIHIHEVGECIAPDFTSAGGHYNPTEAEHGLLNSNGPHAGDLPDIYFYANGSAEYEATTDRIILGPGAGSIFEGQGSAIVIHDSPDDQMTNPSGNSGQRIICGVLQFEEE